MVNFYNVPVFENISEEEKIRLFDLGVFLNGLIHNTILEGALWMDPYLNEENQTVSFPGSVIKVLDQNKTYSFSGRTGRFLYYVLNQLVNGDILKSEDSYDQGPDYDQKMLEYIKILAQSEPGTTAEKISYNMIYCYIYYQENVWAYWIKKMHNPDVEFSDVDDMFSLSSGYTSYAKSFAKIISCMFGVDGGREFMEYSKETVSAIKTFWYNKAQQD